MTGERPLRAGSVTFFFMYVIPILVRQPTAIGSITVRFTLQGNDMDPKLKFLLFDEMIKAGIMPAEATHLDINRLLAELPPDEQRRLKRKFRKLWRTALKKHLKALKNNTPSYLGETEAKRRENSWVTRKKQLFGTNKHPSREQRRHRKNVVQDEMMQAAKKRARENVDV